MFVKVKPRNSSVKLGSCVKLSPKYCGPFEILTRLGPVAYLLAFPPDLTIHNVFHISILKKYAHDSTHVINCNVIQVEPEGYFRWNQTVFSKRGKFFSRIASLDG